MPLNHLINELFTIYMYSSVNIYCLTDHKNDGSLSTNIHVRCYVYFNYLHVIIEYTIRATTRQDNNR